jgi:hypothetical protein
MIGRLWPGSTIQILRNGKMHTWMQSYPLPDDIDWDAPVRGWDGTPISPEEAWKLIKDDGDASK